MIATAVVNLCANALKFNPEKSSNPFAYYTTAIHNSFQNYKMYERRQQEIRDALLVDAGANPSYSYNASELRTSDDVSDRCRAAPQDSFEQELKRYGVRTVTTQEVQREDPSKS